MYYIMAHRRHILHKAAEKYLANYLFWSIAMYINIMLHFVHAAWNSLDFRPGLRIIRKRLQYAIFFRQDTSLK